MKRLVAFSAVVVLSLSAIPFSRAQSDAMKGMEMKDMDMNKCMAMMGKDKKGKSAKSHNGVGTVEKVDPAANTVTIAHGPVTSLTWPAMTMTFAVKDKAVLGKFSQDKKSSLNS